MDARVLASPRITHYGAVILASIVDEDDLQIAVRLCRHAFHAMVQILLHSVYRNDDTDQWFIHACTVTMFSGSKRLDMQVSTSGRK